jgi:simple sugar transport system substrate-binding protein
MKQVKKLVTAMAAAALVATSATVAMAANPHGAKIFVIGGKPDDAFWAKVKKGVDDAGLVVKATGGSVVWLGPQTYDNLGPDSAKLIRTALSQHPDAIVGADWVPNAMDDAFKEVVAAHVPLIIYNSGGMDAAKRLGAVNYVGNDEYAAGVGGGQYFSSHGAKSVLCVNTEPGQTNIEDRCRGMADAMVKGGGKSTELPLPVSDNGNPTAVAQAVKAALLKDKTIDGVVTIGVADASASASAIAQAAVGDKVKLASFDMDEDALKRIKAGTQLFAIDQQPYLQGFLSVALLNGLVEYGLDLPTKPILTGPGIVDASNVDATMGGAVAGAR